MMENPVAKAGSAEIFLLAFARVGPHRLRESVLQLQTGKPCHGTCRKLVEAVRQCKELLLSSSFTLQ
jgi:hypothetical protein